MPPQTSTCVHRRSPCPRTSSLWPASACRAPVVRVAGGQAVSWESQTLPAGAAKRVHTSCLAFLVSCCSLWHPLHRKWLCSGTQTLGKHSSDVDSEHSVRDGPWWGDQGPELPRAPRAAKLLAGCVPVPPLRAGHVSPLQAGVLLAGLASGHRLGVAERGGSAVSGACQFLALGTREPGRGRAGGTTGRTQRSWRHRPLTACLGSAFGVSPGAWAPFGALWRAPGPGPASPSPLLEAQPMAGRLG